MALEDLTGPNVFISNLVRTNPAIDDPVSQGDDHLRGIKNVTLNSFPAITGAVTLTQAQLNAIPTTYAPLASPGLTGVPTAPTAAPDTNNTQIATTAFVQARAVDNRQWVNVTGSRVRNVNYVNDTGRAIEVLISGQTTGTSGNMGILATGSVSIGQVSWGNFSVGNYPWSINATIPPGGTYLLSGTVSPGSWAELR